MGLNELKSDLHDRLWNAQQRWFAIKDERQIGKHDIKMEGVREFGDPNHYMRPIIFTGRTRTTYEHALKSFVEFAHEKFGLQRLDDIDTKHGKAFLEDGIHRGLAAKTLNLHRSALAKLMALVGKTASGASVSRKYGEKIRELVAAGVIAGPQRATPSRGVVERAIEILRDWDARHCERTGQPRAYHLVARLQMETAARSISVTDRLTRDCLKEGSRLQLTGKGGQVLVMPVSMELYGAVATHLEGTIGPFADLRGYQAAWRRALETAGGRVTGTHGLRRLSTQQFYREEYARRVAGGAAPLEARQAARAEAVQRLGHSRDRADQAACYLDPAA